MDINNLSFSEWLSLQSDSVKKMSRKEQEKLYSSVFLAQTPCNVITLPNGGNIWAYLPPSFVSDNTPIDVKSTTPDLQSKSYFKFHEAPKDSLEYHSQLITQNPHMFATPLDVIIALNAVNNTLGTTITEGRANEIKKIYLSELTKFDAQDVSQAYIDYRNYCSGLPCSYQAFSSGAKHDVLVNLFKNSAEKNTQENINKAYSQTDLSEYSDYEIAREKVNEAENKINEWWGLVDRDMAAKNGITIPPTLQVELAEAKLEEAVQFEELQNTQDGGNRQTYRKAQAEYIKFKNYMDKRPYSYNRSDFGHRSGPRDLSVKDAQGYAINLDNKLLYEERAHYAFHDLQDFWCNNDVPDELRNAVVAQLYKFIEKRIRFSESEEDEPYTDVELDNFRVGQQYAGIVKTQIEDTYYSIIGTTANMIKPDKDGNGGLGAYQALGLMLICTNVDDPAGVKQTQLGKLSEKTKRHLNVRNLTTIEDVFYNLGKSEIAKKNPKIVEQAYNTMKEQQEVAALQVAFSITKFGKQIQLCQNLREIENLLFSNNFLGDKSIDEVIPGYSVQTSENKIKILKELVAQQMQKAKTMIDEKYPDTQIDTQEKKFNELKEIHLKHCKEMLQNVCPEVEQADSIIKNYQARLENASLTGNLIVIGATMGSGAFFSAGKGVASAATYLNTGRSTASVVGKELLNLGTAGVVGATYNTGLVTVDRGLASIAHNTDFLTDSNKNILVNAAVDGSIMGGVGYVGGRVIGSMNIGNTAKVVGIGAYDTATGVVYNNFVHGGFNVGELTTDFATSVLGNAIGIKQAQTLSKSMHEKHLSENLTMRDMLEYTPINLNASSKGNPFTTKDSQTKSHITLSGINSNISDGKSTNQSSLSTAEPPESHTNKALSEQTTKTSVSEKELEAFREKYTKIENEYSPEDLDAIVSLIKEYPISYKLIERYEKECGFKATLNLLEDLCTGTSFWDFATELCLNDRHLEAEVISLANKDVLKQLSFSSENIDEINRTISAAVVKDERFQGRLSEDILECLKTLSIQNRAKFLKAILNKQLNHPKTSGLPSFLKEVNDKNINKALVILDDPDMKFDAVVLKYLSNNIWEGCPGSLEYLSKTSSLDIADKMYEQGFSTKILDNPKEFKTVETYLKKYLETCNRYNGYFSRNDMDFNYEEQIATCVTLLSLVNGKAADKKIFSVQDMIDIAMSKNAREYVVNAILQGQYADLSMNKVYKAAPDIDPAIAKRNTFNFSEWRKVARNDNTPVYLNIDIATNIQKNTPLTKGIKLNPNVQKTINEIVPEGSVFKDYNGDLYCNIGDGVVKINLSEKTFCELFPAAMRYRMKQGYIGDCFMIATYTGIMNNPKSRALFYGLFSEDAKGNVTVKSPDYDPITFKKQEDGSYEIEEQKFYGENNNLVTSNAKYSLSHLDSDTKGMPSVRTSRETAQKRLGTIQNDTGVVASLGMRMCEQYMGCVLIKEDPKFADKFLATNGEIPSVEAFYKKSLDGGRPLEIAQKILGKGSSTTYSVNLKDGNIIDFSEKGNTQLTRTVVNIWEKLSDPNYVVMVGSKCALSDNYLLNSAYNIFGGHAYTVLGTDINASGEKFVYISNPHNSNTIRKMKYEDFISHFDSIDIVEIHPYGTANSNNAASSFPPKKLSCN